MVLYHKLVLQSPSDVFMYIEVFVSFCSSGKTRIVECVKYVFGLLSPPFNCAHLLCTYDIPLFLLQQ